MGIGIEAKDLKYYGNFRAKVLDNNDPNKLGRIQLEIYPMHVVTEPKEKSNLPWAVPAMSLSVGAGTNQGSFFVPDIGTFVYVFFEAGDPYQPVYFAEAHTGAHGIPTSSSTDYPATRVVRTKNGIQFKFDDKSGSEDVRVDHPSGSWVEFYPNGRMTLHTAKPAGVILIETAEADISVIANKGDISVTADEGDISVTASKGDIDIVASKSSVAITADVGATVTAKSIYLDAPVVETSKSLEVGQSADGTFITADSKMVTVIRGIVTSIV